MSGMVAEAIRLGARLVCPEDGQVMTVQGKSGAWGHRTEDGYDVACSKCWGYGSQHIAQCQKGAAANGR